MTQSFKYHQIVTLSKITRIKIYRLVYFVYIATRYMTTKAEQTTQYIIEKVAPVFNKHGYSATSMADVTKHTGLTKGAVYGNFANKEELAIATLNYMIGKVLGELKAIIGCQASATDKLKSITKYYRNYYEVTFDIGGCPILNTGVDANHQYPKLHEFIKGLVNQIINGLTLIIRDGILKGEFKNEIAADKMARVIFAQIEGAIFCATLMEDRNTINDMMDQIDLTIDNFKK